MHYNKAPYPLGEWLYIFASTYESSWQILGRIVWNFLIMQMAIAVHPKILGGISAIIEIHTIASARWKKSCTIKLIFAIGFHRSPFFKAQYDHLSIGCDHPSLQIHYGRLWDISGLFNMALKTTLPNTPADWQQTINKHLSTKRASKHKIVVAQ